ncbi:MAG: EscU/YscU/HrcU family type III secretion system export apparatus switch protein [Gammaproteobacteria bacterium]|nr:EscU/YscU/HrcU family type III secretion system export apparatus switch protein [Gammaproteobacteria bacterium]
MTDRPSTPPQRELAVALKYDGTGAPRVTAKGGGPLAERIVELALQHDIPLQENSPLVQLLAQVELDAEIPPALYLTVAEVIAFAYYLSRQAMGDVGSEECET